VLVELGLDEVIDYTAMRFEDVVHDVDVVVDLVGGEYSLRSARVLRPDGLLVSVPSALPRAKPTRPARPAGTSARRSWRSEGALHRWSCARCVRQVGQFPQGPP